MNTTVAERKATRDRFRNLEAMLLSLPGIENLNPSVYAVECISFPKLPSNAARFRYVTRDFSTPAAWEDGLAHKDLLVRILDATGVKYSSFQRGVLEIFELDKLEKVLQLLHHNIEAKDVRIILDTTLSRKSHKL